jgi:molybdopterin-guanine dinucleotide biosynthesis protein A
MGEDKAWLELGGRPMIQLAIDALKPITSDISIIATGKRYETLGLPIHRDRNTGVGPLEAIRTALANAARPRVILLGCDMPLVRPALFGFLLNLSNADCQAVVPAGPDGRLQTLCAVYSRGALDAVTELISGGGRMVRLLFDAISMRRVGFDELKHLAGYESFFENVNTREDYRRVKDLIEHGSALE